MMSLSSLADVIGAFPVTTAKRGSMVEMEKLIKKFNSASIWSDTIRVWSCVCVL